MRIDDQRRSDNFEDRGTGSGGGGGGGVPIWALFGLVRFLGLKGTLIVGVVGVIALSVMPSGIKNQVLGALTGGGEGAPASPGASVCQASQANGAACDFSRAVLASTEDVWTPLFERGALPAYGGSPGAYRPPTLVVFANSVSTGCGEATSATGPFYCPADQKLYVDPSFYDVLARRLRAPGDFAQAYVIAHEVGHHVQNLIGAPKQPSRGETSNQTSVRVELQADCFAGIWAHSTARRDLLEKGDLEEAIGAAAAIGDDRLQRLAHGTVNPEKWTHGSSEQRTRWFRRGYQGGSIENCDTFGATPL